MIIPAVWPARVIADPVSTGSKTTTTTTNTTEQSSRPNIFFALTDDQSFAYTGFAGCRTVSTPTFDRVARQGVYFTHAYCCSPSCTPSRAAMLTGQSIWRLGAGANLFGPLDKHYPVYPDILEDAGYFVGFTGKGWGPGNFRPGGRKRNPAGPEFNQATGPHADIENFKLFLRSRPAGEPFCFWFGSHDPHRPFPRNSGVEAGKKLADVKVPPFLPDSRDVRGDILDYCAAIDRADRDFAEMLHILEESGDLKNTLVIASSDNGMPFPRAKANLYDAGTHEPLAIWWAGHGKAGRVVDDFADLSDLAPTILEAAGVAIPKEMTGRSLMPIVNSRQAGQVEPQRDRVYVGFERHTRRRPGQVGYPCRAVRTADFLYVRNDHPERWPASDPPEFSDIDPASANDPHQSPSKTYLLTHKQEPGIDRLYQLACEKRPAEELYDLRKDPDELNNVAGDPAYGQIKDELSRELTRHLKETGDPRETGEAVPWDRPPRRLGTRSPE